MVSTQFKGHPKRRCMLAGKRTKQANICICKLLSMLVLLYLCHRRIVVLQKCSHLVRSLQMKRRKGWADNVINVCATHCGFVHDVTGTCCQTQKGSIRCRGTGLQQTQHRCCSVLYNCLNRHRPLRCVLDQNCWNGSTH